MTQQAARGPAGDKSVGPRAQSTARLLRIRKIRQLIRTGEYENELKLSVAADRMLRAMKKCGN